MVDQAVDGGHSHGLVLEEGLPLAERLVAGDDEGAPLVALGNEFEEDVSLVLVLLGVTEVVEGKAVVAVELGQGVRQAEVPSGCLEVLEDISDALEAAAVPVGDEGSEDARGEVGLAGAARAEDEDVVTLSDPFAAPGEFQDAGLGDGRQKFELEVVQAFTWREIGFLEPACDPAGVALGEFLLAQSGQEASRRPAALERLFGDALPERSYGWEPEAAQEAGQDGFGGVWVHDGSPCCCDQAMVQSWS